MNEPRAKVSVVKSIGRSSTLVGFHWGKHGRHDIMDFCIGEFGAVEATGTEIKIRHIGWATYSQFHGNVGDTVGLRVGGRL